MIKCPLCETDNPQGTKACSACGTALEGTVLSAEDQAAAEQAAASTGTGLTFTGVQPTASSGAKLGDECATCGMGKLKLNAGGTGLVCETCGASPAVAQSTHSATPETDDEEYDADQALFEQHATGTGTGTGTVGKTGTKAATSSTNRRVRELAAKLREASISLSLAQQGTSTVWALNGGRVDDVSAVTTISRTTTTGRRHGGQGLGFIPRMEPLAEVDWSKLAKTREEVSVPYDVQPDPARGIKGGWYCTNKECTGDTRMPLDPARAGETNADGEQFHMRALLEESNCWCPFCGNQYDFEPEWRPGDKIRNVEFVAYLARGGQGVVGIGKRTVAGKEQLVLIKGLANIADETARESLEEEIRALFTVDHRKIVRALDNIEVSGNPNELLNGRSYLILEFIRGKTLKQLRQHNARGACIKKAKAGEPAHDCANGGCEYEFPNGRPLPILIAMAHGYELLDAIEYLEGLGYVYRDHKPGNWMALRDSDILIDLGGMKKKGDQIVTYTDSAGVERQYPLILGTRGYMPPEAVPVDDIGNNCFGQLATWDFVSDRWSFFKGVLTLFLDFDYMKTYEFGMPTPREKRLLKKNPSVYFLFAKGLRKNPVERYQSVEEIRWNWRGVMREVSCMRSGRPHPLQSDVFGPDTFNGSGEYTYKRLPQLRVDDDDPAKAFIDSILGLSTEDQLRELKTLTTGGGTSAGVRIRLAQLYIQTGDFTAAEAVIEEMVREDPFEWRVVWLNMLIQMARGNWEQARKYAESVWSEIPGELVPKLALAYANEMLARNTQAADQAHQYRQTAEFLYNLVSTCDDTFVAAAFGLARTLAADGNVQASVVAYQRVPASHSSKAEAQLAVVEVLSKSAVIDDIIEASRVLDKLGTESYRLRRLRADVLLCASRASGAPAGAKVFDVAFERTALLKAASHELEAAAQAARQTPGHESLHYDLLVEALAVWPH